MKVIPAIDIKKGKIVKAFAGYRINYKPLIINKKNFSDTRVLISILLNSYSFNLIYIADIDSISGNRVNWKIIKDQLNFFPKIMFWLDLGFNSPRIIREFSSFLSMNVRNWRPIVGTESLKSNKINLGIFSEFNPIFSIDFIGNEYSWIKKISNSNISSELILMFLSQVGGRGVRWSKINKFKSFIDPKKCFVAGGIKNQNDINILKRKQFKGVIISSLIHEKITRDSSP